MKLKLSYSKWSSVVNWNGRSYNETPKITKTSVKHCLSASGKNKYIYTDSRGYMLSLFFTEFTFTGAAKDIKYNLGVQSSCSNDLTTNTYYDSYEVIGKLPKWIKLTK